MKIQMEVVLASRRYYNQGWKEVETDDFTTILMKYNPKKINMKWKGYSILIDTELEARLTKELAEAIKQEVGKKFGMTINVKVLGCSYSPREMARLRKVLTYEKVFNK